VLVETANEAFTAQQALVLEEKPPVSQLASDFVDSLEEEPAIDKDQYEALNILLLANEIDRDRMRTYCSLKGYLLPAKKPTLARLKVSAFAIFRDAIGGPNRWDIAAAINATKLPPKGRVSKEPK
jgi:hypothetical protein